LSRRERAPRVLRVAVTRQALTGVALLAAAAFALGGGPDESADLGHVRGVEARVVATIANVRDSVVTVSAESREAATSDTGTSGKSVTSGGSGVIFSTDGYVLTNDHVTLGEKRVRIGLRDGRSLAGEVTGRDRTGDIAVVKVAAKDLSAAALGDSESL